MKPDKEILWKYDYTTYQMSQAMKEARIDTLLHLKKQFEANAKKLNAESALLLVDELIKEIKK